MSINYKSNSMGDVTYEGNVYHLTDDARMTNRLLGLNDYCSAGHGEEYDFEMAAPATDEEGNEYMVYWIFNDVKGYEIQLDEFDYGIVDRVQRI